jgi:hypothetical protein
MRWAPAVILIGVWAVITSTVWLSGQTYYLRDFWTNYVPARYLLRDSLAAGHLFLWNPWINGGLPALPDPNNSVLYPPGWPFLLLADQAWALSLTVDLHLLLAACGTYLLARRAVDRWGALAAAAAFAFGGLMLSNRINVQLHFAYAWMPLWFWIFAEWLDRIERRGRALAWGCALAAVWAAQLLASDPQTAYVEGMAGSVLIAARVADITLPLPLAFRAVGLMAAAAGMAAALALLQLWSLAEALGQSGRTFMSDAQAASWSVHPLRWWELVMPLPWGGLTPVTTFWGGGLVRGPWYNFYFTSLYLGALTIPLCLLGIPWKRRGTVVIAAGVAVLLVASLGETTPLHGWLRHTLPLWSVFRYPERLLVIPTLAAALLIGRGAARAIAADRRLVVPLLLLPAALAGAALMQPGWLGPGASTAAAQASVLRAFVHVMAVAAAAVALLLLRRDTWRAAGLSLLICVDLLSISPQLQSTWRPPPADTAAPGGSPLTSMESAEGRVLYQLPDISQASSHFPPEPAIRRAFEDRLSRPNLNSIRRIRATNGVTSVQLIRSGLLIKSLGLEEAAVRYATRYLIAADHLSLGRFAPARSLEQGLALYRVDGELSEAACYANWVAVPTVTDAVDHARAGEPVIEGAAVPATPDPSRTPPLSARLPCRLQRQSATTLSVTMPPATVPVLVRVAESYYPGWTAEFGGGRVPVVPADVAFLGAIVPPATTEITFRYAPSWLLPVTGVTLGGWVALVVGWGRALKGKLAGRHPRDDQERTSSWRNSTAWR